MTDVSAKMRLDKWLWQARFVKSRSLAAGLVKAGHVRVDGTRVSKASYAIAPDAVLTFPQGDRVRVVKILALGSRRGPASEAQMLYEDLVKDEVLTDVSERAQKNPRFEGGGRPTKRDRRRLDQNRRDVLE